MHRFKCLTVVTGAPDELFSTSNDTTSTSTSTNKHDVNSHTNNPASDVTRAAWRQHRQRRRRQQQRLVHHVTTSAASTTPDSVCGSVSSVSAGSDWYSSSTSSSTSSSSNSSRVHAVEPSPRLTTGGGADSPHSLSSVCGPSPAAFPFSDSHTKKGVAMKGVANSSSNTPTTTTTHKRRDWNRTPTPPPTHASVAAGDVNPADDGDSTGANAAPTTATTNTKLPARRRERSLAAATSVCQVMALDVDGLGEAHFQGSDAITTTPWLHQLRARSALPASPHRTGCSCSSSAACVVHQPQAGMLRRVVTLRATCRARAQRVVSVLPHMQTQRRRDGTVTPEAHPCSPLAQSGFYHVHGAQAGAYHKAMGRATLHSASTNPHCCCAGAARPSSSSPAATATGGAGAGAGAAPTSPLPARSTAASARTTSTPIPQRKSATRCGDWLRRATLNRAALKADS